MPNKKTVLFVCTGNVCRSPMAAGLFYDQATREDDHSAIRICSAGIWALVGQAATAYARQVMSERDLDIDAHHGRNLTQQQVDDADLILVMTKRHAAIIRRDHKRSEGKVFLLSEMTGAAFDIEDPYGGSLADYRQTATELAELIERGYSKIMHLLGAQVP